MVNRISHLMRLDPASWRGSAELAGNRARTAAPSWGSQGVLAVLANQIAALHTARRPLKFLVTAFLNGEYAFHE